MKEYTNFIPENVALLGARIIGVYNDKGNRVGYIPLGNLAFPTDKAKSYSFGAISDVHLAYTTGESDYIKALKYFTNESVDFICIAGDLSDVGTDDRLERFKTLSNTYAPNTPIYVSAGNHDAYNADWTLREASAVNEAMLTYTGKPLYHSFEYGDDVFIFVGVSAGTFTQAELQWLYETLERYRNKRCFLFQHCFNFSGCGNVFGLYEYNMLSGKEGKIFLSLMEHYHNVIWFHGHSHTMFHGQEFGDMANYDKVLGCHSVHIPSCAIPRTDADGDFEFQIEYQESEGYMVDVYENGIHLRGRDFARGKFLPIASYWLDTTIEEIPEKTYTDSTGTITT